MRMTSFEAPFDDRAIKAMLGRIRIDHASLELAIRRTVESLAYQPRETRQPQPQIAQAPKRRAKAVAAVRASNGHPGTVPETWQGATKVQLAWWRDRYSWHSTLFVTRFPSRSPAEMVEVAKRADKWGRKRPKAPPVGRTVAEFAGDVGLAYVLPQSRLLPHFDWATTPNRDLVQRVADTDPTHYGAISRRILEEIAVRDAADAEELAS